MLFHFEVILEETKSRKDQWINILTDIRKKGKKKEGAYLDSWSFCVKKLFVESMLVQALPGSTALVFGTIFSMWVSF